jgi:hypothetical protein
MFVAFGLCLGERVGKFECIEGASLRIRLQTH